MALPNVQLINGAGDSVKAGAEKVRAGQVLSLRVAEAKPDGTVKLTGAGITLTARAEQPLAAGQTIRFEVLSREGGVTLKPLGTVGGGGPNLTSTVPGGGQPAVASSTSTDAVRLALSSLPQGATTNAGTTTSASGYGPSGSGVAGGTGAPTIGAGLPGSALRRLRSRGAGTLRRPTRRG